MKMYVDMMLALIGAQLAIKYLSPGYLLTAYLVLITVRMANYWLID
jgi:hypothetical protein